MALLRIVVAAIVSAGRVSGCATIDLKSGFSDAVAQMCNNGWKHRCSGTTARISIEKPKEKLRAILGNKN